MEGLAGREAGGEAGSQAGWLLSSRSVMRRSVSGRPAGETAAKGEALILTSALCF